MCRVASSVHPAQSASEGLREAKRALRERVLHARDALPPTIRSEAGQAIVASLIARADYSSARTLLLTLPFGSEWDTRPLLELSLGMKKRVVLPRVNAASRMLELCAVEKVERDAAPGFRGIYEPGAHCELVPLEAIDWVLVPGVAFDAAGGRIGYGGGYYDRMLPLLRPDARRIAAAFEVQIVDLVPAAAHDLAVDAVVTEKRSLTLAR